MCGVVSACWFETFRSGWLGASGEKKKRDEEGEEKGGRAVHGGSRRETEG